MAHKTTPGVSYPVPTSKPSLQGSRLDAALFRPVRDAALQCIYLTSTSGFTCGDNERREETPKSVSVCQLWHTTCCCSGLALPKCVEFTISILFPSYPSLGWPRRNLLIQSWQWEWKHEFFINVRSALSGKSYCEASAELNKWSGLQE